MIAAWRSRGPPPKFNDGRDTLGVRGRTCDTQTASSDSQGSPYLSFVVALHVATALALDFYRKDWVRIVAAFVSSIRARRIDTPTEHLAWLLVVATVPVGLIGLVLEQPFRIWLAKPMVAAAFLTVNELILLSAGELRRTAAGECAKAGFATGAGAGTRCAGQARRAPVLGGLMVTEQRQLDILELRESFVISLFQTLALLTGISRSGITRVAGLLRGLDHEEAAKFSFLLGTPVILAAGELKLPSLAGPAAANIHGQVLVGAVTAGVAAYLSARFLTRYFTTRTLILFAIYSLLVGIGCLLWFGITD